MLITLPGVAGRLAFADWPGEMGWYERGVLGFTGFATRDDANGAAHAVRRPLIAYL